MRLSQCMITKNEEKNIKRALDWAKGIAFEQIVVDTGSTDRTVEIAESHGAKVYHFEWINDFSAAKNFAIEQASGDWIAFLDADEFLTSEDVKKIMPVLEMLLADSNYRKRYFAVECPLVNVNDEGKPISIYTQQRFLRNMPNVRYVGLIHEQLNIDSGSYYQCDEISIIHTGYSESAFKETNKTARNILMIRSEIARKPSDINLKAYLADTLVVDAANSIGDTEKQREAKLSEAEKLYREVTAVSADIEPALKKRAYAYLLHNYANRRERDSVYDEMGEKAHREFPDDTKLTCYYAATLNKNGKHKLALDILTECETKLNETKKRYILDTNTMVLLCAQMIQAAQGLGDIELALEYATVLLTIEKSNAVVLRPFIATVMSRNPSVDNMIGILEKIYDLGDKRDLLILANAAKDCGAIELAKAIVELGVRDQGSGASSLV